MKNLLRTSVLSLCFAIVGMAYGAVPPLNVTVSDASGKAAFKGTTDKSGAFATPKVRPGNYVVQFNSPSAIKGSYAIVVSAGVKKVSASAVAGEKLAKGGVALKVTVGNLLNIVGQVAAENNPAMKDGKAMVWIPPRPAAIGRGVGLKKVQPAHMEAKTAGTLDAQSIQDRGVGAR